MIKNIKNLVKNMDKLLLIISIVMFSFGLLNILNASSREAVVRYEVSMYHYFIRQLIMLVIGIVLSYVILNLRTKAYGLLIKGLYIIILIMVLALFFIGVDINGAKNWLPIPGIGTIQPSEFAKPIIIVYLSVLFEKYIRLFKTNNNKKYEKIGVIVLVGCLIPALTFLQKDFGTMLVSLVIFGVMFISSPLMKSDKIKTILVLIGVAFVGMAIIVLRQGYLLSNAQLSRFNFYNPCSKYETTGYQVCNGFIALNDGGLFGLGIGKSKQKYSYIPEPHTDSVFAIIGEENGLLRSSLVFIAYIVIIYRILKISNESNTIRGRYICLGVATYIFMHIFINLGGLFGIIPLTGVPLPFLSYGGSYAISLMCSLAVVQRINYENKTQKIKIKKPI